MENQLERLAELVERSGRIAVLTGAGISTESGIPDFRSPGGVWTRFRIVEYDEFLCSEPARMEDWRRRFAMHEELHAAQPNLGHQALQRLVASGKCKAIITQNIDRLHQHSGLQDTQVIEIHGNARSASCLQCGQCWTIERCIEFVEKNARSPHCDCGGIIKCNVIMFGQAMPEQQLLDAQSEAESCDLFLSIGTSLTVHPAAGIPALAHRRGAKLVIINRDATPLDSLADLVINAEIGETLESAIPRTDKHTNG